MESDYHNPYDHHLGNPGMNGIRLPESIGGVVDSESDHLQNHYEAPSCLVRNPSGSLFIPSAGDPLGQTTLDSRLRYDAYSPHHQLTMTASGHHLRSGGDSGPVMGHQNINGSPCRSPNGNTLLGGVDNNFTKIDSHNRSTLPTFVANNTLSTRLGNGTGPGNGANMSMNRGLVQHGTIGANNRSSPNSSSAYSSNLTQQQVWRTQKPDGLGGPFGSGAMGGGTLGSRCSWKFVAIFFMLLSVILVSALIYSTASNFLRMSYDSAKACAVVETGPSSTGGISSSNLNDLNNAHSSSISKKYKDEHQLQAYDKQGNYGLDQDSFRSTSNSRASLPPDGTTFSHLSLGEKQTRTIPPYSFWNFQFHQKESSYVEMDFILARGSSLGLYARKNAIPTLTLNDVKDVLTGFRSAATIYSVAPSSTSRREARSLPTMSKSVSYYMAAGHWFLSLYNDDGESRQVSFMTKVSPELTRNCPKGCHGKGECVLGRCQCKPGFDGPDCGQSMCPVLCSGNGDYEDGVCRCFPGWKGIECQLRSNECEIADCNGHGKCVNGVCNCARGFTGKHCKEADCEDPTCSGHGFCVEGSCVCRKGWRGTSCDQMDHEARQCLPDCSGHGEFDLDTQKCVCRGHWTGSDCSKERCNLDCGPHGSCESGHCICEEGWQGSVCSVRVCDSRCSAHGMCSNGTCLCTNGWNGKHCTLEGCPSNCNGHGQCKANNALTWECLCDSGWYGAGCNIYLEQDCSDRKDNDGDGLTDCEDPECCDNPVCQKSQLCHTVPRPIDILLRKQPPSLTASFFERMKFIIEDKGLQSYVQRAGFNESRAAVVRGQVITSSGMGLIGVRVSTTLPNEGFTMTREDGWFDLMVNGGGPVMLQFGRNPYPPLRLNVFVPWNEVVVLDPVKLSTKGAHSSSNGIGAGMGIAGGGVLVPDILAPRKFCPDHDYDTMKPLVLATWKHNFQGQIQDRSAILVESQAVQESLKLANGMHLVYHSARTKGYLSTIQLQLTPSKIPASLVKVHIKITIEGVVHEKVFEADPDIRYTYAWDRLNEYRQRVYGITTATVKVGYEYSDCDLVWNIQSTKLSGHDMTSSDIDGWNLNVQHKYNYHAGILQKGDGNTVYLKYKPQVVTTIMGNGDQRSMDCVSPECSNGSAEKQKLLGPKSIAASPDGALYVADYNIIRKISPDSTVKTILKLNSSQVSYRFHLAHCTLRHELEQKQTVFVSQPESHRVIRIKNVLDKKGNIAGGANSLNEINEIENNWEPFIGNGKRCLPGASDNCGDEGKAIDARLSYPKGVTVGADGKIFVADGTNIRQVDENGIITTLIGHQRHRSTWRPMPCGGSNGGGGSMPINEVQLNWPTELSVSPLDGSLHIVDDGVILKVTTDGRVQVVAGRPLHCSSGGGHRSQQSFSNDWATSTNLVQPQSIAFSPNGDLYVAESDSQRINRVRMVATNGKISIVAGREAPCNCLDAACSCFEIDQFLATNALFNSISSIAVTPDSVLYIADQGNARIRAVSSSMSVSDRNGRSGGSHSDSAVFEVPDPDTNEAYVFNKFGQHMLTRDIMTGNVLYKISYNQATSNGKLSSVTDGQGRSLTVMRDYKGRVNALQTADGLKYTLKMSSGVNYLESFEAPDKYKATFRYDRSSGLIKSKSDNSNLAYVYEYDEYGRLVKAVTPTGEALELSFNLTSQGGATINVKRNGVQYRTVTIQDNLVSTRATLSPSRKPYIISIGADKTLTNYEPWDQSVILSTIPHPAIAATTDPVMADSFPMIAGLRTRMGSNLVGEFSWKYSVTTNGRGRTIGRGGGSSASDMMNIRKTMVVNGKNLLTVFYDKLQKREVIYAEETQGLWGHRGIAGKTELLEIRYDSAFRPISWEPMSSGFNTMKQAYDRFGHIKRWSWGDIGEIYNYDGSGRLTEVVRGSGSNSSILKYSYSDASSTSPNTITTASGGKFEIEHDNSGGLKRIQTARGHFHLFRIRPSVGIIRFQYQAPWISDQSQRYELVYDASGRMLSKRLPSDSGERVTYSYDNVGQLRKVLSGETESEFGYDSDTGTLDSVITRIGHHFNMRTKNKYHSGLLKEQKVIFLGSSSPDFDNAVFRYQYDGNGRPSVLISGIGDGSDKQQTYSSTYNSYTGQPDMLDSGVRVIRKQENKTILQDNSIGYYKSTEIDGNGRPAKIVYGLNHREMLTLNLRYNSQNLISSISTQNHEGRPSEEHFEYKGDGHLHKVAGPDNYLYRYDENGNLVGRSSGTQQNVIQYDKGDRVEKISRSGSVRGSGRNIRVTYDPVTGCVSKIGEKRRFWHDSNGRLVQLVAKDGGNGDSVRVSFHHDHLGRLAAWTESRNKVTSRNNGIQNTDRSVKQFFYADVRHPNRLTHFHNPKISLTQRLLYDEVGHLIAIETRDEKMFIATGSDGSPLLVYRADGKIVKEITYSPFGQVVRDTNPSVVLPIGYRGGIVLPYLEKLSLFNPKSIIYSPILYFMPDANFRVYDAEIAQWLTLDWESLVDPNSDHLVSPLQLFPYRFINNDPINAKHPYRHDAREYVEYASTNHWASLYGYNLDQILDVSNKHESGSLSSAADHLLPEYKIKNHQRMVPNFWLQSSLESSITFAKKEMCKMSFVQDHEVGNTNNIHARLIFNNRISTEESAYGNGFLLSVMKRDTSASRPLMEGLAVANVLEGTTNNGNVVQSIFESLLNGSTLLQDISYLPTADKSVFYFAKYTNDMQATLKQMSIDRDTVNRLSGEFTVRVVELDDRMKSGKDLKINNDKLELHVLYGESSGINRYRDSVIQSAAKQSSFAAWSRERNLVKEGFTGYGDWTNSQRTELIMSTNLMGNKGNGVRGYEAVEIQPQLRFPELTRDQSNYGFISDIQQRRRKNRHGKNRKSH